jgi:hypothetical protein
MHACVRKGTCSKAPPHFFFQAAIRRKLREIAQKMERWRAEEEKKKAEAEREEKEEQERRQTALEGEQRIAKVLS